MLNPWFNISKSRSKATRSSVGIADKEIQTVGEGWRRWTRERESGGGGGGGQRKTGTQRVETGHGSVNPVALTVIWTSR